MASRKRGYVSLEERAGYGKRRKERALQPVSSMGKEMQNWAWMVHWLNKERGLIISILF